MTESANTPRFAVLGTGNSGQAYAADITLKGFSVNLAEVPEFEDNILAIEKKGGIDISGDASNGFAKLNMITTDLKEAIRGVDVIIIGGSAYAHEPFSKALANHFEDGQFIVFTSNFGALRFKKWMHEIGVTTRVTPVETMSLLYATRARAPGVVACIGIKNQLPAAALPAGRTSEFLNLINPVFPQFIAAENVWTTSINNLNPIVHPPMVLFNAGRIDATGGKGWNLYADGATESVCKVMLGMDAERMSLLKKISSDGIPFKNAFENLYAKYSLEKKTLSETLRQSPIHGDSAFPAPASVNTRYLNEDLPFGLSPWSSIGRMWDIPTPKVDAVIQIASIMTDVDYFQEGLAVDDLGIKGMNPEDVRALVN
ncbi:MAG: NAD/NADP octopine/nopaline dehydrogenase family protein [Proteobacteria bacterium]|nr:NAD/NADP octopine/nopaline dehydrogenase family protein [Pseudomonadota bacterium]